MFRAEEHHNLVFAKVNCSHTTVRLLHLAHKMQRVASKLKCIAYDWESLWAGWKCIVVCHVSICLSWLSLR